MYGPCRSPIGGGQALTPPSRHRLGRPLPYQLADSPQAAPRPKILANILAPATFGSEDIDYYPVFRKAIIEAGVRSYVLLPRLPVVLILLSGPP